MGVGPRLFLASAIGVAALVAGVGLGSAQDFAFCAAVKNLPAVQSNIGVTGAGMKAYDFQGGVWCSYGTHGPYVQRIPHVSKSKFKSQKGAPVKGLSGAVSAKAFGGYTTVSVLKGTTELVVGAKAPVAKIAAAAKAILPLVH